METAEAIRSIELVAEPHLSIEGNNGKYIFFEQKLKSENIVYGIRKTIIEFFIRLNIFRLTLKNHSNPLTIIKILRTLDRKRRQVLGEKNINKLTKAGGKYYWDLYTPGWRSKAFNNFIESEINRISPIDKKSNRFTNIFVAITKKCSLQCEHCFEWDELNKKETLSTDELKQIIFNFQELGTAQIQLTGGEPLLKVDEIAVLLKSAKRETEFWILTSGYNLSLENAVKLKDAGLTGIVISLDHFDEEMHNQFRGFKKSFQWVQEGIKNALQTDLVTALSLCPTRSFTTSKNLLAYAELAKKMGVSFIQILEPKAVGHYGNKDVLLNDDHKNIIEDFYLKMNYDKKYRDYPIVCYHGYHQKRIGCFASGNRNLYVDTDGDLHACPFCQSKTGNALSGNLENSIAEMQAHGCHSYKNSDI